MYNLLFLIIYSIIIVIISLVFVYSYNKEYFQVYTCNDDRKYGVTVELTFKDPYILYNSGTDIVPNYTVFDKSDTNNRYYTSCFIGRRINLGIINGYSFPLYFYITGISSSTRKGYIGYILDSDGSTLKKIITDFYSKTPVKLNMFTTKTTPPPLPPSKPSPSQPSYKPLISQIYTQRRR